ncbi:MAG: hypothetical protein ACD_10C00149G0002 [uncultured bacterium]|nr:MAG: hypothetical protein ACD_10C00149G0002 [uncultured bacterium]
MPARQSNRSGAGHLLAADALYRKGLVDDAIGLSYHPEAEMMEEVRANLAAHGAPISRLRWRFRPRWKKPRHTRKWTQR